MSSDPIVILSARRTPVGAFQGVFAGVTGPQLGSVAVKAALADSGVPAGEVDEIIMGCVLSAGVGQAPARQAALGAGLPAGVPQRPSTEMCGSAMRAIMLASDQILAGSARVIVAGGLESMTNAPYLLPKARAGYRMGHQEAARSHDLRSGCRVPGRAADGLLRRGDCEPVRIHAPGTRRLRPRIGAPAQAAVAGGYFSDAIAPVTTKTRKGEAIVDKDETPGSIDVAKIPTLRPAFKKDGTVTAASSASISDGAAAVVLTRESFAAAGGFKPLARILGYTSFAREPEWFTVAPVGAVQKLLSRLEWRSSDVDLSEGERGFRRGCDGCDQGAGSDHVQVNVNGGARALDIRSAPPARAF